MSDEAYLRRALALARRARGRTAPNPMVGAVLVKDGRIVGEGYHHRAGEPHAEILALREAGAAAAGATLYVTLEPCSHHGRTPPCAEAVIAAGVTRVVFPSQDPNPLVAGRGREILERAGIEVLVGPLAQEADQLNEAFRHFIVTGKPFVTAKWAMTLDGKIATRTGDSRWISGEASRRLVHRWRAESGAILVGIGTARQDDPQLTARRPGARQPLRVVVDSQLSLPPTARLLAGPGGALVATREPVDPNRRQALEAAGGEVLVLPATDGRVDLEALLTALGARGITSVLVEGGGEVLGVLFDQGLVDKVAAFIAPKLVGGEGPAPVRGQGALAMVDAWQLGNITWRRSGEDILLIGYPRKGCG